MVRQRPCMEHRRQDLVLLLLPRLAMAHHPLGTERLHPTDSLHLKIQMPSTSNSDR
jgi:hypothetical protein